jgi:hypothetical protein
MPTLLKGRGLDLFFKVLQPLKSSSRLGLASDLRIVDPGLASAVRSGTSSPDRSLDVTDRGLRDVTVTRCGAVRGRRSHVRRRRI